MARMLTQNFSLDEFVFSQTAARRGIDNTPDVAVLRNLQRLADTLEEVRSRLGDVAILVSSGYRSPALNKAVKGAKDSAHLSGLAVDFTAPRFGTVLQTAKAVSASDIAYDQVIYEFGRWVHLGLAPEGEIVRRENLSIMVAGQYFNGLRNVA